MSLHHALILSGGRSRRMGKDKSSLAFEQKIQHERIFTLLQASFNNVFFSIPHNTENDNPLLKYPHIKDIHPSNCGPMLGILSALHAHTTAWFVVAIDMPAVNTQAITLALSERDAYKKNNNNLHASVALSPSSSENKIFLDPLFGIYEANMLKVLKTSFKQKQFSLQKILKQKDINICTLNVQADVLVNINTPEEYNLYIQKDV